MVKNLRPGYSQFCQVLSGNPGEWGNLETEEWRYAKKLTEAEGVGPLLYWAFKSGNFPPEMPEFFQRELTRSYYTAAAHNTLLIQELNRLLNVFSRNRIPVVVLKGSALAASVYLDVGLRPMGDLDLLIQKPNVQTAFNLISDLGYYPAEEEIASNLIREVVHTEYWEGGPNGLVGVELHWNLIAGEADDRAISADWFWDQVEFLPGVGDNFPFEQLPTLNPTAHLLYVAGHMMLRHAGDGERLIWFYDIDRLIRTGRVDWEAFIAQARALSWGPLVRYALEGAASRFGTPVPAGLPEAIPNENEWGEFLVERQKTIGRASRWDRTIQSLKHLSWPWRWRMMWALIAPSPRYLRWRYSPNPEWTWPWLYFFRWWEVSKELFQSFFPLSK